jgi:hypothetical protein
MRNTGIDADDEVHALAQRGGVGKIFQQLAKVKHVGARAQACLIGGANFFLQADVARPVGQARYQLRQRQAAIAIVLVGAVATPRQTNARCRGRAEPALPAVDLEGICVQVSRRRGDVGKLGFQRQRQTEQGAMTVEVGQGCATLDK